MPRLLELAARGFVLFWGLVCLAYALVSTLAPRAHYVRANPVPGTRVDGPPAAVEVRFDRTLGRGFLTVTRTVDLRPDGEEVSSGIPVARAEPLDRHDEVQTLVARFDSVATPGLYAVQWSVTPRHGWMQRNGLFYFGVGMDVPAHTSDRWDGPIRERDNRWRDQRATWMGAVALIAIALLPRPRRRRFLP